MKEKNREYFYIPAATAELRAKKNDGNADMIIEGYASVFDVPCDMGWYTEYIRSSAFTKTIKEADVRCLFNHNPDEILGRNKAGTLTLSIDAKGLKYENKLPSFAANRYESIQRGDVTQSSFAFRTVKDNWFKEKITLPDGSEGTKEAREILEVRLFDVSPVTYPAYTQTSVGARDMLSDAGIDVEVLNRILFLTSRGRPIGQDQRNIIQTAIEFLSKSLSGEPGDHSNASQPDDTTVLRERLKLIEMDF